MAKENYQQVVRHMKILRYTHIRRFIRDNRGLAYMEFALTLPFLLLLFAGSVDVTRMVLLHQKIDKAVFTVGDLATQLRADSGVCAIVAQWEDTVVRDIMLPFDFTGGSYNFVMSSVLGTPPNWDLTGPRRDMIEWRYGNGPSQIGAFSVPYSQVATLPATIAGLNSDERVIVTEMTYKFTPLLPVFSNLTEQDFRKVSYFRSRISTGRVGRGTGELSRC